MEEEAPLLSSVVVREDEASTTTHVLTGGYRRVRVVAAAAATLLLVASAAIAASVAGGGGNGGWPHFSLGKGSDEETGMGASRLGPDEEPAGPLVSIVATTYNVEKYIGLAINSALNQTYRNIELIVVDDHSNDATVDVVKSIKDIRAPWINIVRLPWQTVGGAGAATNSGLECAAGKYVLLLDGDDVMMPDAVEELVRVAEAAKHPPDYVMAQYLEFYEDDQSDAHEGYDLAPGGYWNTAEQLEDGATQAREGEVFHPLAEPGFADSATVPWRLLLHRNFLDKNGIRMREVDGVFEDNSFKMALDVRARGVATVRKVLFHHRKGRAGATTLGIPTDDDDKHHKAGKAGDEAAADDKAEDDHEAGLGLSKKMKKKVEREEFRQFHPIIRSLFDYAAQYEYIVDEFEEAAERARVQPREAEGEEEKAKALALAVSKARAEEDAQGALGLKENDESNHQTDADAGDADAGDANAAPPGDGETENAFLGFAPIRRNHFAQRFASKVTASMRISAFDSVGVKCDREGGEGTGIKRPWGKIRAADPLLGPLHAWTEEGIAAMKPREAAVTRKWRAKLFGRGDAILERFGKTAEDQRWTEVMEGVACIRASLKDTGAAVTRDVALTVAIPFHNSPTVAERVKELVAGLREQKGLKFEIIVVDNNSDDGSQDEMEAVADADPDVYFMKQPHQGAGRARNLALKAASGRFIFFLDSDDSADPAALAGAVEHADTNGHDLLMLKYRINYLNSQGGPSTRQDIGRAPQGFMLLTDQRMYGVGHAGDDVDTQKWAAYKLVNYPWIRVANLEMVRKNVIFFPPFVVQNDVPYHWLTIARASNLGYFDQPVVTHRWVDAPQNGEVAAEGMQTITNIESLDRFQALHSAAYTYRQLMKIDGFAQREWAPGVWVVFVRNLLNFASKKVPPGTAGLFDKAGDVLVRGMFEFPPDGGGGSGDIKTKAGRLGEQHQLKFRAPQQECNEYKNLVLPDVQKLTDSKTYSSDM